MSKGYRYYNHEKRRWIGGNAALLHVIKEDGGLIPHYNKIVNQAIGALIDEANQEMRPQLKVA